MEKHNIIISIVGAVIIGCILFLGESSVLAESVLSAEEVTQLFSGKTVEGINVRKGFRFKAYHDPNGTIRAQFAEGKRQGKWYVDDDGRRCLKFEDQSKEKCQIIVNDGGVYKQFKINKRGKRQQQAEFTKFTEGNLYGL
jgi:hypothetical protein